jgi:hypothetical protein
MRNAKLMDETELRVKALDALNKALGPGEALRFLGMLRRDATDYVKVSRLLYKGQTVDQIFARARKQWRKQTG